MTHLSFRYSMRIEFDSPVSSHSFSLRCCPKSDERQTVSDFKITVKPEGDLWQSEDNFGNRYTAGSVHQLHDVFEVEAEGTAAVSDSPVSGENELRENIYKYKTRLTAPDGAVSYTLNEMKQSDDPLEMANIIMDYLHEKMSYVPGSTFVETTAAESLAAGKGVCQDYAHIMLAMLRARKMCARYVVGMMEGEGFSHAWVEVRHNGRWYGFDPTNHTRVTDRYIKMSHGRDYNDCMINTGCMTGLAMQTVYISVSVKNLAGCNQ